MKTQLDSQSKIVNYDGPLFQSHGTVDYVIPYQFGKQLYEACPSQDKQFMTIEGGRHNDYQPREYFETLHEFLERLP